MENFGQEFDVIVIGAGVMGSATAYHTAKRGLRTLLLEQFDFLHHRGSSHGESRTIRPTYSKDYYSTMAIESSRLWQEAEAEAGYTVYYRTKHLDFGPSDNKGLISIINNCRKNSIAVRVLNSDEVSKEFAGVFQLPNDWIGVVTDQGGLIKPSKAVAMLQRLALQNGAVLKDNAEVTDINKPGSGTNAITVRTSDGGEFRAGKCVIAAGPWTKRLIKKARGLVLPIQPLEMAAHYWKIHQGHEDKFTIDGGFPTFTSHGVLHIYGTPSLEFPGLIKVPIDTGRACEPDSRTWAALPEAVESLQGWIKGTFRDLVESEKPVMTQSCMYSMTPDEDYVIDFLGGEFGEDAVVCGGFSGHGFKMAPVVGRMVAEMVAGESHADLTHFKLGRFEGELGGTLKHFDDEGSHS